VILNLSGGPEADRGGWHGPDPTRPLGAGGEASARDGLVGRVAGGLFGVGGQGLAERLQDA
jgi:hypothetical protein